MNIPENLQGLKRGNLELGYDREVCRRSLLDFVSKGWSVLENKPFINNWHIQAVCEHLEAVSRGDIRHLLILIPPGCMKSLSCAVFWPAWVWGPNADPGHRWMFSSYTQPLSNRDSYKCRQLIRSSWYQRRWGEEFQLATDRDTIVNYYNNKNGYRLATSVEGMGTGERGNTVVVDDPHNVLAAESEAKRSSVIKWWDEVMQTRVNEPTTSAFVVMMQRVHSNDLAGHILETDEDYTVLRLPMEYEPEQHCYTCVKPKSIKPRKDNLYSWDPRKEDGELLFPKRFPREEVDKTMRRMGSYATAAQYQMRPSPRGGGLVKLSWFQRSQGKLNPDLILRIIQSWDTADKGGQQNAYSVCITAAQTETSVHIQHVLRRRMNIPTLERTAMSHAKIFKPQALIIEDQASGVALCQKFQSETDFNVYPIRPDKDKVTRMDIETPAIESGRVYLPEEADWLSDFEAEVEGFPNVKDKDQVDALSQLLKWVREHQVEEDWSLY